MRACCVAVNGWVGGWARGWVGGIISMCKAVFDAARMIARRPLNSCGQACNVQPRRRRRRRPTSKQATRTAVPVSLEHHCGLSPGTAEAGSKLRQKGCAGARPGILPVAWGSPQPALAPCQQNCCSPAGRCGPCQTCQPSLWVRRNRCAAAARAAGWGWSRAGMGASATSSTGTRACTSQQRPMCTEESRMFVHLVPTHR